MKTLTPMERTFLEECAVAHQTDWFDALDHEAAGGDLAPPPCEAMVMIAELGTLPECWFPDKEAAASLLVWLLGARSVYRMIWGDPEANMAERQTSHELIQISSSLIRKLCVGEVPA